MLVLELAAGVLGICGLGILFYGLSRLENLSQTAAGKGCGSGS